MQTGKTAISISSLFSVKTCRASFVPGLLVVCHVKSTYTTYQVWYNVLCRVLVDIPAENAKSLQEAPRHVLPCPTKSQMLRLFAQT